MHSRFRKSANSKSEASSVKSSSPNPYGLAILTAVLSGALSIVGGYFIAEFQARHAVMQKQLEYRVVAYNSFLDKVDQNKSPSLSELLNLGRVLERVGKTDGEIQGSENRIATVLERSNLIEASLQLNSAFDALALHGSKKVAKICNDIQDELMLKDDKVDWSSYSEDTRQFHMDLKASQQGSFAYGWESKVTNDERFMIFIVAKLMAVLVDQLRREVQSPET